MNKHNLMDINNVLFGLTLNPLEYDPDKRREDEAYTRQLILSYLTDEEIQEYSPSMELTMRSEQLAKFLADREWLLTIDQPSAGHFASVKIVKTPILILCRWDSCGHPLWLDFSRDIINDAKVDIKPYTTYCVRLVMNREFQFIVECITPISQNLELARKREKILKYNPFKKFSFN